MSLRLRFFWEASLFPACHHSQWNLSEKISSDEKSFVASKPRLLLPANHHELNVESIPRMLSDVQDSSPVFIQNASLQATLSVLRARIDLSLLPLKHSNGISLKHSKILWQEPCICAEREHTYNCRIVDFNFRQLELFCRPACCSFPGAGADSRIAADDESITSLFLDSYPESDLSRCEVAGSTGFIWS